ncbi:hypothetical protein NMG60_11021501 [Bertholletia excelsa]
MAVAMMKKMVIVALVLVLISSSHMDGVVSDVYDCYDACNTGCVKYHNNDTLYQECDKNCTIRCDTE